MSTALTKAQAPPSLPEKITGQWLARQPPAEVHAALTASLARCFGVRLVERGYRPLGSKQPPTQALKCSSWVTQPDFAGALALLEAASTPASEEQLEAALAELSTQVSTFGADGAKADLQIEVYVRKLMAWPADVVLDVLRTWPTISKPVGRGRGRDLAREWPSWFDLESELMFWGLRRRNMIEALRHEVRHANAPAQASC
jgi:hypothetical protein